MFDFLKTISMYLYNYQNVRFKNNSNKKEHRLYGVWCYELQVCAIHLLFLFFFFKQNAQCLHGDIAQSQREITLKGFREGSFKVLVATNVAARGLDIPEVDLVIQSSPPQVGNEIISPQFY